MSIASGAVGTYAVGAYLESEDGVSGTISNTLSNFTSDAIGTVSIIGTTGSISVTIDIYEPDIMGTTTVVGVIAQQIENFTSSIYGFIGDEDTVTKLRTVIGTGT